MIVRWLSRLLALGSFGLAALGLAIDAIDGAPILTTHLVFTLILIPFLAVGWLIAERQPANLVGRLLVAFGPLFALYILADAFIRSSGDSPVAAYAALFIDATDVADWVLLTSVVLLFPSGALPSPAWRKVIRFAWSIGTIGLMGRLFQPGPFVNTPTHSNPLGIEGFPGLAMVWVAYLGLFIFAVLAVTAMVVRWRRGDGVARAQLKWVAAAAATMVASLFVTAYLYASVSLDGPWIVIVSLPLALFPLAIGVAILRYRLYAIDRIISRGIAYGLVSAILGAAFAGIILGLQSLLAPFTNGQTIAVAASTLVVFALFQPLRRRVQTSVDRRFDRSHYDADQTVRTFAARLRDDLDLGAVRSEVVGTATAAVRPTKAAIWLRGGTN